MATPEVQDLVTGIRVIPFLLSIKNIDNDPEFEKYSLKQLKEFPGSTYQMFFDTNCYDEFFSMLQNLSLEDWNDIGMSLIN